MQNVSKLFFSTFLILILSGCLQNLENKPKTESSEKITMVTTNQNVPEWPNCDFRLQRQSLDLASSEVVPYSDKTHGIFLELPFNPKWSVQNCPPVPPFEKTEEGIVFGPVGIWDNRVYILNIKPQLSIEEAMQAIKQSNQEDLTFKNHQINGVLMLEYFPSLPGKCPGSSLIVFGEKNNFELDNSCGFPQGGIENEAVVKSIRLLAD